MEKKLKLVYECQVGKCSNAPSMSDCGGVHICDRCKLCTSDGMIVKKVKQNNIVYKVSGATADEILLYSPDHKKILSVYPNLNEFIKNFEILETNYDYRCYW